MLFGHGVAQIPSYIKNWNAPLHNETEVVLFFTDHQELKTEDVGQTS